jgi:hypothetical protein
MTTAELGLATSSAATLSISTTIKSLVYHGPGKCVWEDKPHRAIRDAGDIVVRIITLRWGSKAWWAFTSLFPLSRKSSLFKVECDVRHSKA